MCIEFTQCLGLKEEVCVFKNKHGLKNVLFRREDKQQR